MVNKQADNEKLSALMDGELVDKALISELTQNRENQETWRNYHLIGDVMRGDVPEKEWNIADSVALALENEAPHSMFTEAKSQENIVSIEAPPTPSQARKRLPAWLSHLGQVSIAASVCLAVVLGIQQTGTTQTDGAAPQAIPVLETVPLAGVAEPVSWTRESAEKQASDNHVQEQRRRVNALLQDYELQLRLNSGVHSSLTSSKEPIVE
jgi:sigma-E factor negative regulatory protein RseA